MPALASGGTGDDLPSPQHWQVRVWKDLMRVVKQTVWPKFSVPLSAHACQNRVESAHMDAIRLEVERSGSFSVWEGVNHAAEFITLMRRRQCDLVFKSTNLLVVKGGQRLQDSAHWPTHGQHRSKLSGWHTQHGSPHFWRCHIQDVLALLIASFHRRSRLHERNGGSHHAAARGPMHRGVTR